MAKPASGTALNTGSAYYSLLANCWALLEGTGTTSVDSKVSNVLTLSSSGNWGTNAAGDNAIVLAAATATPLGLASAVTLVDTNSWSIAWGGKELAADSNGMILGDNTVTSDFIWFQNGTALSFRNTDSTQGNFTALTTFTTEANYLLTYQYVSGVSGTLTLYKNGSAVAAPNPLTTFDGKIKINTLGNGYTSNTFSLKGTLSYVYIFNTALSSGDATALDSDPYTMFRASGGGPAPQKSTQVRQAVTRASYF